MTDLIASARQRPAELAIFITAFLIFVGLLSYANFDYAKNSPGGNDFIPRWLGTRLLLTDGQSPYSEETTQAIQQFIFGGLARPDQDQSLFAYPLYSILIFLPYALIGDYILARAFWLTTLQVSLIITAIASSRLVNWRMSLPLGVGLFLYVLLWYYSVRPLINGNAAILSGLFIVIALLAIRNHNDLLAGPLLALSTIKPQVVILLIPILLLWAASQKRRKLIISTVASMAVLVIISTVILPDWMFRQLEQVRAYSSYTVIGTPSEIFTLWWPDAGNVIGLIFSILAILTIIYIWKRSWRQDFQLVLPAIFLTLAATNFAGIATATSNYSVLFPGLILAFALYEARLGRHGRWWTIAAATALLIGLWILFWTSLSGKGQPTIMYFPLPLLLIITFLVLRPQEK